MSNRAIRRHHRQRLIKRWEREHPERHGILRAVNEVEYRFLHARVFSTTRCVCSCWMCGNPRRYYGNAANALTRQEVISDIVLKEEML